eukprot:XP_011671963.1 PREDICTED: probable RING finger protein 207 homolog [Strongylocentrotus purpuratus]
MCDAQPRAIYFCCDCSKDMCHACLELHNKWPPHLKHKVVSVEDIREGKVVLKKKVYCQEEVHESDDEKYVCTDVCTSCKKLICLRCRMLYHTKENGHTVQDVGEYNSSFKEGIESLQARGKTKAKTVENYLSCVDNQLMRVNDHFDGEQSKINKTCEEAINKIKQRNVTFNMQLDAQKEKLCQSLKKMKVADERLVTSVESASELASNSLKAPLEGDIVVIRDSLSGELKNVLDQDDPKRKLASDVAEGAEELTFTPSSHPDQLSMGELLFIKCESKCDVALSKKDDMNALAATKNGRMAVGYHTGGIDIFSEAGKLQQTELKGIKILALGFLSDGQCVVRHTDNNVSLYKSGYEKLDVSFNTLDKSEGGLGDLTVDSNDLIYVSYRKAKKIQVFSQAGGKAIREIECDAYEPSQITSYGDSLIVQRDGNTIIRIDKKGDVMHRVVSSSGHYLHASVTKGNSIMIASVRHEEGLLNIDEYTGDLQHIKTLISYQKIEKPQIFWYYLQQFQSGELAFCTKDRLYIFDLFTIPVNP